MFQEDAGGCWRLTPENLCQTQAGPRPCTQLVGWGGGTLLTPPHPALWEPRWKRQVCPPTPADPAINTWSSPTRGHVCPHPPAPVQTELWEGLLFYYFFFCIFIFLNIFLLFSFFFWPSHAACRGFISPTRDQNLAPCIGSVDS